MKKKWVLGAFLLLPTVCFSHRAPVVDAWQVRSKASDFYRVQKGDTLYSIAFAFNQDYRKLASRNHMSTFATLKVGDRLKMSTPYQPKSRKSASVYRAKRHKRSAPTRHSHHPSHKKRHHKAPKKVKKAYKHTQALSWYWPSKGRMVSPFTGSYEGNRGVDIKGYYGSPIRAAASGVVVYIGKGVRGYPRLIILKHTRQYLSAYSNNARILVKQGQTVHSGQLIAKMGRDTAGRTRLHFELRRNGQPVNPKYVLPRDRV